MARADAVMRLERDRLRGWRITVESRASGRFELHKITRATLPLLLYLIAAPSHQPAQP